MAELHFCDPAAPGDDRLSPSVETLHPLSAGRSLHRAGHARARPSHRHGDRSEAALGSD
jgi:hypothetical protein